MMDLSALDGIRIIAVDICPHTSLDAFLAVSRYQDDGYRPVMFPVPRYNFAVQT